LQVIRIQRKFGADTELRRIHSRESFLYLLDREVKRASRYRYTFCILSLTLTQLPANRNLDGLQICFQRLCHWLEKELREIDILGFLGDYQLGAILPYTDSIAASRLQSRLKGNLARYALKEKDYEVTIDQVCFPYDGLNAAELILKINGTFLKE
jgi:GGDEF domain-containing protein